MSRYFKLNYTDRLENLLLDMSYFLYKSRMVGFISLSKETGITTDKKLSHSIAYGINLLQEGLGKENFNFLLELKRLELIKVPDFTVDDLKLITICFKSLSYILEGDYEGMETYGSFILDYEGGHTHQVFHS